MAHDEEPTAEDAAKAEEKDQKKADKRRKKAQRSVDRTTKLMLAQLAAHKPTDPD